jgi:hypothetical protein
MSSFKLRAQQFGARGKVECKTLPEWHKTDFPQFWGATNECTPPASQAGATLLGWSTTPNFPIAVAQRQVENGWGTYESYNTEGQFIAVFIPAGKGAYLSGSSVLYAIWSK